jgi:DNA-binding CsgD family transcriptional regulator
MSKISIELRKDVIDYFLTNRGNTAEEIATFFKIKPRTIHTILDKYFKSKL